MGSVSIYLADKAEETLRARAKGAGVDFKTYLQLVLYNSAGYRKK